MAISGIADYAGYDPNYMPEEAGSSLGKDDFLKLIVAQLSYQDPLEPLSSSEFMNQMSVMGQLEELQNMNANFEEMILGQGIVFGSQLIGQPVQAIDQTTRSVIDGIVGGVGVHDGEVQVQVGDYMVPLKDILAVKPWTSSTNIMQASQLIGMKVTALDPNDLLGFDKISGIVEEASNTNGEVYIKFTDEDTGIEYEIRLQDIIAIGTPPAAEEGEEENEDDGSGDGSNEEDDESGDEEGN